MKKTCFITLIGALFFNVIAFAQLEQTTLPLSFDSGNPAPYGMASTPVKINGKQIPLLVDLGASKEFLALTDHAVKGIHIKYTKTKTCGTSVAGKKCYPDIIISEFKIGQFTLHNVHAVLIHQLWGGNTPKKMPGAFQYGVIGMKFLSHYNALFDYAHSKLILTRSNRIPSAYPSNDWITIPFIIKDGVMTMSQINGHKPIKLIWDTGAIPSIVNLNNTFGIELKKCPQYFPYLECHQKPYKKLIYIQQFSVGNKKIPNTWFMLEKLPSFVPFTGLVGDNYFRKNLVFIDFKNKTISIHAVNKGNDLNAA